jgi:hypothetical protein
MQAILGEDDAWTREVIEDRGRTHVLWRREADGLELTVPERRVVITGTADLAETLRQAPNTGLPGADRADAYSALLALPETGVQGPFGTGTIRVRDLEVRGTRQADAEWSVSGRMVFDDDGVARAMTVLVRVAAVGMISQAGADPEEAAASLEVERDGRRVVFDGIVVAEQYLLDALEQFVLERESRSQ